MNRPDLDAIEQLVTNLATPNYYVIGDLIAYVRELERYLTDNEGKSAIDWIKEVKAWKSIAGELEQRVDRVRHELFNEHTALLAAQNRIAELEAALYEIAAQVLNK